MPARPASMAPRPSSPGYRRRICTSRPAWAISTRPSTHSRTFRLRCCRPDCVEGNRLPYAPELQGHFGIGYTIHAGKVEIVPRADVSYQGETFFDATNTREIAQDDAVTTVNVQLQVRTDEVALHRGAEQRHRRAISRRRQFLADHGQRLRGDRLRAAARVVRDRRVRVLGSASGSRVTRTRTQVVIIGAGPAGLAARASCCTVTASMR